MAALELQIKVLQAETLCLQTGLITSQRQVVVVQVQ
jgi:hypothetical protein